MTVIGYTRVSSRGQETDGSGLDVQADKIRAWCAYQGLTLDGIKTDTLSGATMDRPGFRLAVRTVLDAGPGSVLIVYKLDRLGRNAVDVQDTLAVLLDGGVRVVSIVDGVDSASGMGKALLKLLVTILAGFAELERETIAGRMADGKQRAKADGRVYAKEAPYGWSKTPDGRLSEHAGEQAAIVRARALRAEGKPLRAIGRALLLAGHAPRTGETWRPETIARMVGAKRTKPSHDTRVSDGRRARVLGQ
jgi:DNA invertase Pin-like site-specific DNA recombinase